MIDIRHIASGSSGNAILVDDGHNPILFDAGISFRKLTKAIKLSTVTGVFITHEHGDHCKAVPNILKRGLQPVYMSSGTIEAKGFTGSMIRAIQGQQQIDIEGWTVLPFDVEHDAAEPLGFLAQSHEWGKVVYMADSSHIAYDFSGVTHWIIEANYADDLLEATDRPDWLKDRIRRSHFSFEQLLEYFREADITETEAIYLIHLSEAAGDRHRFQTELEMVTGIPVYTEIQQQGTVYGQAIAK